MNAIVTLFVASVLGNAFGYYVQREVPYNVGPNDPYLYASNPYIQEPSQRLFFGSQGSNTVGTDGSWWSHFTNKFPFLGNWFGRYEVQPQLQTQYGVPEPSTNYGVPANYYPQAVNYQPQLYQPQSSQPQLYQPAGVNYLPRIPSARDVGFTDDAVIVTPPHVPISPIAPPAIPQPEPDAGYRYNKPQNRLELPQK